MKHMWHIPSTVQIGGQMVDVINVERLDDDSYADCTLSASRIRIANICAGGTTQSYQSKVNSYYHELVHMILNNMGRFDMSKDEMFVSTFAGFLTEAMVTAETKD